MKARRWDMVHKFEDGYKEKYLKKLSASGSFKIMDELYRFALLSNKSLAGGYKVTKKRMRFLMKERARFKKITL